MEQRFLKVIKHSSLGWDTGNSKNVYQIAKTVKQDRTKKENRAKKCSVQDKHC